LDTALAARAGNALVTAATTGSWERTREGFARLLGRDDPEQVRTTGEMLDQLPAAVAGAGGADADRVKAELAAAWTARLAQFLTGHPDAESELTSLIGKIGLTLPGPIPAASDTAAGGVTISANRGSVAAGVIQGDVVAPPPSSAAGSGERPGGPWPARSHGPGSVIAENGGTAIGAIIFHQPGPRATPVSLPPRQATLADPDAMLAVMHDRLTAGHPRHPAMVALNGMGGIGKTTLAVEYAHRHRDQPGIAWLFHAEDSTVLAAEFRELAAQLGVLDRVLGGDPVASVHAALAAQATGWLLIFDNARDEASVARFLPPAGPGRVVITSQSPRWPPDQAIAVPVLSTGAAARFLSRKTGDPDQEAAAELAGELGGLPLAVEQAAAYITAVGGTTAGYLALLREHGTQMLTRGEPARYDKTVATTWSLAFAALEQEAPQAAMLLKLLACCAPEPIPVPLLLPRPEFAGNAPPDVAPLLRDNLAVSDAIAQLRRYSLISFAGNGAVLVHRLVQAVTLSRLPAGEGIWWRHLAVALMENALPADPELPENWPVFADLLPHLKFPDAMTWLSPTPPIEVAPTDALHLVAEYLGQSGSYATARDQFAGLVAMLDAVGDPDDPQTLAARQGHAYWTGQAGDAAAARDAFADLLPDRERVLGPDDPDTLVTRHELARWTGEAGDSATARDLLAELLPVRERVSGAEDPDTLTARGNLAGWTGRAGDHAAARDMFAELQAVTGRVLGTRHRHHLMTLANLAGWAGRAGDPAAARDQYAALLPIQEQVLGPDHPHLLTTRRNLARWTGEAGDPAAARDQYATLLPIHETLLGTSHPLTKTTREQLAQWARKAGDDTN